MSDLLFEPLPPYDGLFERHACKEHWVSFRDEVRAFYLNRPGTTDYSLAVCVHMGAILCHSTDLGALTLQPFAPDPFKWLHGALNKPLVFFTGIAENQRDLYQSVTLEAHRDAVEFVRAKYVNARPAQKRKLEEGIEAITKRLKARLKRPGPLRVSTYLEWWEEVQADAIPELRMRSFAGYDDNMYMWMAGLRRLLHLRVKRLGERGLSW